MPQENEIDATISARIREINQNWAEWRFRCSEWEKQFVGDTLTRWRAYGPALQMSVKQRNRLVEIHDKIKDQ